MSEGASYILGIVGFCLLILAGVAGILLVQKAITAKSKDEPGTSTLWGLFIIGLVAGLWLIVAAGRK